MSTSEAQVSEQVLRFYRATVKMEYCYYVEVIEPLTASEENILKWLVAETFEPVMFGKESLLAGRTIEIGPRLNFETAWSSNAVAIARACGLAKIKRLELSRRYRLANGADEAAFVAANSDRMTECRYENPLLSFALNVAPEPVRLIPLIEEGIKALERANKEMGLGLPETDMEYYLDLFADKMERNPTDVEIFWASQGNSEHSRHGYFKGVIIINGKRMPETLMEIVKSTLVANPKNSIIAFSDNSSALRGYPTAVFFPSRPGAPSPYHCQRAVLHPLFTAETHNFPSGVAPFPGAETGTGGRIRDVQATGRGGIVIAGTAGYCVGNLYLPGYVIPGEPKKKPVYPANLALPPVILIQASNGASDYGNKFGEPVIAGICRTFGMRLPSGERREWLKPIMFTGGLGMVDDRHTGKHEAEAGMLIVQIGGPAYRIGMGGGAASSMGQGENTADLDFNAVQRGNAEMENKTDRVVRACIALGEDNPIETIHDQGAGGPGNVLAELVEKTGGRINIRKIQSGDPTLSVRELWSAEYQERLALLIRPENFDRFEAICKRENITPEILGEVTGDGRLVVYDEQDGSTPLDLDLKQALTGLPQKTFRHERLPDKRRALKIPKGLTLTAAIRKIFRLPSVGSKGFLVRKVDRSVTGLIAQQQCCGPAQLPVADFAVVAQSYFGLSGAATSIGEQPIKMLLDPKAGARMAVAEALLNLAGALVDDPNSIKCSLNWMGSPKLPGEGARFYDSAAAARDLMIALGVAVDGGKDSLSMYAKVDGKTVKAPCQMVVSLYAAMPDIAKKATPDLKRPGKSRLAFLDLAGGKTRLGGSALAQALGQLGDQSPDIDDPDLFKRGLKAIRTLLTTDLMLAYHDVSDGGLSTALAEMAMAGNCGLAVKLPPADDPWGRLFAEEAGCVIEYSSEKESAVRRVFKAYDLPFCVIAETRKDREFIVRQGGKNLFHLDTIFLRSLWEATSDRLEQEQMDRKLARRQARMIRTLDPDYRFHFEPRPTPPEVIHGKNRPAVAIIREEGSNGDREMAAAFYAAGCAPWDVTMTDLREGRTRLENFRGAVFVGGFSYADALDSAKGWAGTIRYNPKLKAMFDEFYHRKNSFSLGVCNGCQLMALLGWVPWKGLPDSRQPRFIANLSGRFESRWVTVAVRPSPAIMLRGMEGARLGIHVAHGEGRLHFPDREVYGMVYDRDLAPLVYVDPSGEATEEYPANPNGSPEGITALCSDDGRHLAMMPHPERTFLKWQWGYLPEECDRKWQASPWLKMFQNAREWCERT